MHDTHSTSDSGTNARVVLIAVWFGPLPNWFPLWLRSAGYNKQIDFKVVADHSYDSWIPENVEFISETRERYSAAVSEILEHPFELRNSYKLCDLRILLPKIYPKLVAGVDWWGYCDLDVIWGDLSLDINELSLNRFDKVGLNGHCSLWKRSRYEDDFSRLFTDDYRRCLADIRFNYALDEHSSLSRLYAEHPRVYLFRHDLNLDPFAGYIRPLDYYHRSPGAFFWHSGKLVWRVFSGSGYYDTHHSYMHFQQIKMDYQECSMASSENSIFHIRYGRIAEGAESEAEVPTNEKFVRLRALNLLKRFNRSLVNRLSGGNRSKLALR